MEEQRTSTAVAVGPRRRRQRGFTLVQLVVVIAVVTVVTTFGFIGVSRARASMRLSSSAREMAGHLERARGDAVRRRAWSRITRLNDTTYRIEMDLDGNGTMDERVVALQNGVTFISDWGAITFDWRGRTAGEVSLGLGNDTGTSNINVSGAGDITLDSQVFHDASIPAVSFNSSVSGDIAFAAPLSNVNTSVPYPTPPPGSGTETDPPPGTDPKTDPGTDPPPGTDPGTDPPPGTDPGTDPPPGTDPKTDPGTDPPPETDPKPPAPCSITLDVTALAIQDNGSKSVKLFYNNMTAANTITPSGFNGGQMQVSPSSFVTPVGSGFATFTVTVKKQGGSITFTADPCGQSQSLTVTVG